MAGLPGIAEKDVTFKYKFWTDSPYIIPYAYLTNGATGNYIYEFLPGDFQKIEIYN